jgi:hypothetical protein
MIASMLHFYRRHKRDLKLLWHDWSCLLIIHLLCHFTWLFKLISFGWANWVIYCSHSWIRLSAGGYLAPNATEVREIIKRRATLSIGLFPAVCWLTDANELERGSNGKWEPQIETDKSMSSVDKLNERKKHRR